MEWVVPKWMALNVKGRRMRAQKARQRRRERGEREPFPKQALMALLIAGGLSYFSYISSNQIVDVSACFLVPVWVVFALAMSIPYFRS
jgi:hypothetical protein